MSDVNFQKKIVFTTNDWIEVHVVKGLFEQARIKTELHGSALCGALGEVPAQQDIFKLSVYAIKFTEAKEILVNYQASRLASESNHDWQCLACSEFNGPAFEYCWQCGSKNEKS